MGSELGESGRRYQLGTGSLVELFTGFLCACPEEIGELFTRTSSGIVLTLSDRTELVSVDGRG